MTARPEMRVLSKLNRTTARATLTARPRRPRGPTEYQIDLEVSRPAGAPGRRETL